MYELTGFMRRKDLISMTLGRIRRILDGGQAAACVHIYLNGLLGFEERFGKSGEIRLLHRFALLLREVFPDSLMGRQAVDRFFLIAPADEIKEGMERIQRTMMKCYPETVISVKAGGIVVEELTNDMQLAALMRQAEDACNSIVLFDGITYISHHSVMGDAVAIQRRQGVEL